MCERSHSFAVGESLQPKVEILKTVRHFAKGPFPVGHLDSHFLVNFSEKKIGDFTWSMTERESAICFFSKN